MTVQQAVPDKLLMWIQTRILDFVEYIYIDKWISKNDWVEIDVQIC